LGQHPTDGCDPHNWIMKASRPGSSAKSRNSSTKMDIVWHDAARTEYLWRHLGDWWRSNCLGRPDPLGVTCPLGKLIVKPFAALLGASTHQSFVVRMPARRSKGLWWPTDSRGWRFRFVVEQIARLLGLRRRTSSPKTIAARPFQAGLRSCNHTNNPNPTSTAVAMAQSVSITSLPRADVTTSVAHGSGMRQFHIVNIQSL
jgi:hypothetical protein